MIRETACIFITSLPLGPGRMLEIGPLLLLFLLYMGASLCTKLRGTNSVKPCVPFWISLSTSRCFALCNDDSRWPYMTVEVVGIFKECASLITLIQSLTLILPGEIRSRIL